MELRSIAKNFLLFASSLRKDKGSKILFYHDVYSLNNYSALDADIRMGTHIELFKEHLNVIRQEGYEIVDEITKPIGQVAIMFDDGFRGIYEVRDFFYSNRIHPTVFLAVGYIGNRVILSPDEIIELQDNGFRFECHTWSHKPLVAVKDDELKKELYDSKEYLSRLLEKEVTQLCLPLGYYSSHLLDVIRGYGYNEIYSSVPGNYEEMVDGRLRARNLCQFSSPSALRMILRGGNEILRTHYERLHNIDWKRKNTQ